VRFFPDFSANDGGIDLGHAGSGLEGFRSMLNNLGINQIEQIAKADLLVVMLFANVWRTEGQKDMPTSACSLAPPLYLHSTSN